MIANQVTPKSKSASAFRFLLLIFSFFAFISSALVFHNEAFCGQATVAWDPETVSGLAGYRVHYGTVSRNYSFVVDVGNQTTATITGLTAGATYYLASTAYNTAGTESAPSNEVTYTVPSSCGYVISPGSASFTAAGGTGSVTVTTSGTCSWTAANPPSWISITSRASGVGNGTVKYSVSADTGTGSRTAAMTIAGAVFTATQTGISTYAITASAGTGGSISPSGRVNVNAGASQSFTITPASGYKVAAVTVDGASAGAVTSYTFTNVIANHTISATFVATNYTLTISKAGTGSGTVTNSPSGTSFAAGTIVTLTAAPNANSTFAGWSGGCSGTATTCTVTMSSNQSVTATFSVKTYAITASAGAGGSISPSGRVNVNAGASQSFTITPTSGYQVAAVTVDGTSVGAVTSYTFSTVTANHTIAASFSITGGSTLATISVSPSSSSVGVNGTQQFTATAKDQTGNALLPQPNFTWTVTGGGTITSSGLFTAGSTAGGPYTVTASSGGVSGTASVTVTAGSLTIGETNILSSSDNPGANVLVAQQTSLGQPATLVSMSLYVATTGGAVRLGIYDATGPNGGPGQLRAQIAEFIPVSGWNTRNVVPQVSLPAGTYWLTFQPSRSTLNFKGASAGTARSYTYSGVLPGTFSTAPQSTTHHWSFYATLH